MAKLEMVRQFAEILLIIEICIKAGLAQVPCHTELRCEPGNKLGDFATITQCCTQPTAVTYDTTSEQCKECLTYGWTDTFPIEVVKGEEVTLTVGFLKGEPPSVFSFNFDFESDEVSVSSQSIILRETDVQVRVTVSESVNEGDEIRIILGDRLDNVASDHAFITDAVLIVVAQEDPTVMIGFNATAVTASESEGTVTACISATSTDSVSVNVTITAIDGTAVEFEDYSLIQSSYELTANTTECITIQLTMGDGYEETESFTLILTSDEEGGNVIITRNSTEITILDSDEAYIIVDPATVVVKERSGETVMVCLNVNGSTVDVIARVRPEDLPSHEELGDLVPVGMLITQVSLPADGSPVCLEFEVVDDDEIEGTETILATWEGVEPRVVPALLTIIIEDFVPLPSPSPSLPPPIPPSSAAPTDPVSTPVAPTDPVSTLAAPTDPPTFIPSPSPSTPTTPTEPPVRLLSLSNFISDTISGGAFIATLINAHSTDTGSPMDMALCYEIHGEQGRYFNFLSQPCLSLNARYMLQDPDKPLHFIDEYGLVVTDNDGNDVQMRIDRNCDLFIGGSTTKTEFYNRSGIAAEAIDAYNDVVIDINSESCGEAGKMKMVVSCQATPHGLMQLDVNHNVTATNLTSHGLLGQFWGYQIQATLYGEAPDDYLIEISPPDYTPRQIVGSSYRFTWEYRRQMCLYVGDRQGGKGAGRHGGPNDPLIEREYTDYLTDGPFDTSYKFSQFGV